MTTGVPGIASITIKFIRLQLKHQEYDDRSWLAHVVTMKVPMLRVFSICITLPWCLKVWIMDRSSEAQLFPNTVCRIISVYTYTKTIGCAVTVHDTPESSSQDLNCLTTSAHKV